MPCGHSLELLVKPQIKSFSQVPRFWHCAYSTPPPHGKGLLEQMKVFISASITWLRGEKTVASLAIKHLKFVQAVKCENLMLFLV